MKSVCKKKYVRRIMIILLSCFIFMIGRIFYLYFNAAHIQNRIKEKVCAAVLKHEDDLLAAINECKNNQKRMLIYNDTDQDSELYGIYYYKKLNSKTVNKVFKKFRLAYINCYEDDLVDFLVTPSMIRFYLWGNYTYGFYYTAKNQPVIIFNGDDCDTDTEIEIYDIIFRGNHWYRTEKIDDNWYFYEDKVKY